MYIPITLGHLENPKIQSPKKREAHATVSILLMHVASAISNSNPNVTSGHLSNPTLEPIFGGGFSYPGRSYWTSTIVLIRSTSYVGCEWMEVKR